MARPRNTPDRPPTAAEKLDAIGVEKICELIVDGNTMGDIADQFKVTRSLFVQWCYAEPERLARVSEARIKSAAAWDELATREISRSADPFELSRAKELAHHYRWRASKIAPREYGDKLAIGGAADMPPIQSNVTVDAAEAYKRVLSGEGDK